MDHERILTGTETEEVTGLADRTRRREEEAGRFPKRIHISKNRVGWLRSEIQGWIKAKAGARGDARAAQ